MIEAALFLYDYSGNAAMPWAEAGVECWCVDIQHSIRRERLDGNIRYVWGDARSFRRPSGRRFVFAASFSPCTHVSANTSLTPATLSACRPSRSDQQNSSRSATTIQ